MPSLERRNANLARKISNLTEGFRSARLRQRLSRGAFDPRDDIESQNNQTVVDKALLDRGTDAIVTEATWKVTWTTTFTTPLW